MRVVGGMLVLSAAMMIAAPDAARAQAQQVIDVASRGQAVRSILLRPSGSPAGSLILIAGGHGNLSIGKDGNIAWGKGIHVVRARADFARAGFAVLLPDIAADQKKGEDAVAGYRSSVAHAMDLGALVAHMRRIAQPVVLVGTDRGAISVTNAAVRLSGDQRPDAIVLASGTLLNVSSKQPSVEASVPGLQRIAQPTLLLHHAQDACRFSQPAHPAAFQARFLSGTKRVDIKTIGGGRPTAGDQCGAQTSHGFAGQDGEVVRAIAEWVKTLGSS